MLVTVASLDRVFDETGLSFEDIHIVVDKGNRHGKRNNRNDFGYEFSGYRIPVELEKAQIFPITSNEIIQHIIKIVNISRVNSLEEFMKVGIENKLTHLVIKEKNEYIFLDDIFKNEDKYDFLIKEYDSRENGHKIHLKIFKVNYEKYPLNEIDVIKEM